MANVKEHKERILEICEGFSGTVSTAKESMRGLASLDCPAFAISAGQASHLMVDSETLQTTRDYTLTLLGLPIDIGWEFEGEELCEPFFPQVEEAFSERPGLYLTDQDDSLDGVQTTQVISDTGFIVLDFGTNAFAGAQWTIQVVYLTNIQQGW